MVVDVSQLVIELNEPIRDCPPLFGWMLAKIESSTTQPLLQASGNGLAALLELFTSVGNLKSGERGRELRSQLLLLYALSNIKLSS